MPQGGKGRRTPRHRRTLRLGGSRRPRRVAHGSRKSESASQWALQHDHHGGSVWIPIQRSACNLRRGVATGSRRAPLARQRTGLPGVGTPSYHTWSEIRPARALTSHRLVSLQLQWAATPINSPRAELTRAHQAALYIS